MSETKPLKFLVFTEGTILMHKSAAGHSQKEIINQVQKKHESVHDYASYLPVGNAAKKLSAWKKQGAEIAYLTSRKRNEEIAQIKKALKKHGFPDGKLLFRKKNEQYKDIAERTVPDILIEDDCESIGGKSQLTITHVQPGMKKKIKSIIVEEFEGIDKLPDSLAGLKSKKEELLMESSFFERQLKAIRKFAAENKIRPEEFAVFGSGPLAIRQIRKAEDIDLIVAKNVWKRLAKKYTLERKDKIAVEEIEIYDGWKPWIKLSSEKLIKEADVIAGVRFVKLERVIEWKKAFGRKKDIKDLKLIKAWN